MQEKLGGRSPIKIALVATDDLIATFGGTAEAEAELSALIAREFAPGFEVEFEVLDPPGLAFESAAWDPIGESVSEGNHDIVLLSVAVWLGGLGTDPAPGEGPARGFGALVEDVSRRLKEGTGAHGVLVNGSTLDPTDPTFDYSGAPETARERIRRLNLACFMASMAEGVSVVDVDRIVADLGGEGHVRGPLDYSPELRERIRVELARIMDDIGFFESRPLLAQVGQRTEND